MSSERPLEFIGYFLQLSLSIMEEAGGLGKKLMRNLNIEQFEPNTFYPFQIRHDFYQTILDHLGWEGLFIFGTRITEFANKASGRSFSLIERTKSILDAIQSAESQEELNRHIQEFLDESCQVLSEAGAETRRGVYSEYKWSAMQLDSCSPQLVCI